MPKNLLATNLKTVILLFFEHIFSINTRYLDDEIEQRRQRLKKRALARQVHEAEELLEIEEEQEKKEDASSSEYETEYESEEDEGPRLKPVFVRQKGIYSFL